MNESGQSTAPRVAGDHQERAVEVVLTGGPAALPASIQLDSAVDAEKIKIQHYGGYEHFERDIDHADDGRVRVYRWVGRTKIAE
ncbi:DUF5988 family protein [Micromonospora rifamycinica]|uniref:DUF5988 family protein n=1 Tax=Micromonospora rifamycinica TaxID=291594 RepID=UPI003424E990